MPNWLLIAAGVGVVIAIAIADPPAGVFIVVVGLATLAMHRS